MKRSIPIPKDSAAWFRARARFPKQFEFTADGNLQVPSIRDEAAFVIEIPSYRRATVDEIAEVEQAQKDQISAVEEQFDSKMMDYMEAIQAYRETGIGSVALALQRELAILESQLSILRSPLRWVRDISNPVTRDIFPNKFYETKHIGHDVYKWADRKLKFEDIVREGVEPEEGLAEEREGGEEGGGEGGEEGEGEEFLLFYGTEDDATAFLSPEFHVDIIFNGTKYSSALQAYEVERVVGLGRKDVKVLMLKTRSVKTIRTIAAGIQGLPENPQQLWTDIYTAMMAQHKEFAARLLETGTSRLVYANPVDTNAGIGLPIEDPSSLQKDAWKGRNWLGLALEAVRSRLKIEASDEAAVNSQEGGGAVSGEPRGLETKYTEAAKTADEEKKERQGAIQGFYRRGRGGGH